MKRRIVSIMLALALVLSVLPLSVMTSLAATEGTCGKNAVWSYEEENETLTISGTGMLYNQQDYADKHFPWETLKIKTVVIESGVESIPEKAFMANQIKEIYIPYSVYSIKGDIFTSRTDKDNPNYLFFEGTQARLEVVFKYSNNLKYFNYLIGYPEAHIMEYGYLLAPDIAYTMKLKSIGGDVKQLQEILVAYGYLNAVPDGSFGVMTEKAVLAFQAFNGLETPDGMVGAWTRGKINSNPLPFRTLVKGDTFSKEETSLILRVQKKLKSLYYLNATPDGGFGNYTLEAIKAFQQKNGLEVNGTLDIATLSELYYRPVGNIVLTRTLCRGNTGEDVKAVQKKLYELGFLKAEPDGVFGAKSEVAVRVFQVYNGLAYPDGKVGAWTLNVLNSGPEKFRSFSKGDSFTEDEKYLIAYIQLKLACMGLLNADPDGSFGSLTQEAVKKYQRSAGLPVDGTIGLMTFGELFDKLESPSTLSYGSRGFNVLEIQGELVYLGFLNVDPDGSYGAVTEASVKVFQAYNGLASPDGKVGSWTLGQLNGDPYVFSNVAVGLKHNLVKVMQTYLKKLGYLNATPDGSLGAKTKEAFEKFMIANGIAPEGDFFELPEMLKLYSRESLVDAKTANLRVNVAIPDNIKEPFTYGLGPTELRLDSINASVKKNSDNKWSVTFSGKYTVTRLGVSKRVAMGYRLTEYFTATEYYGNLFDLYRNTNGCFSYEKVDSRMKPGYYIFNIYLPQ